MYQLNPFGVRNCLVVCLEEVRTQGIITESSDGTSNGTESGDHGASDNGLTTQAQHAAKGFLSHPPSFLLTRPASSLPPGAFLKDVCFMLWDCLTVSYRRLHQHHLQYERIVVLCSLPP